MPGRICARARRRPILHPCPTALTDERVLMCPDIMPTGFSGAERVDVTIRDTVPRRALRSETLRHRDADLATTEAARSPKGCRQMREAMCTFGLPPRVQTQEVGDYCVRLMARHKEARHSAQAASFAMRL